MKKLTTGQVITIVRWYNTFSQTGIKDLPIKIRWDLKKNISALLPTYQRYSDFEEELINEIRNNYFTDEKSELCEIENDGNNEVARKIKSEYIPQFQKDIDQANIQLNEIILEESEFDIKTMDLDEFVDNFDFNDSSITFEDIEFLEFMDANNI